MLMAEPITTLTDYGITLETVMFVVLLWHRRRYRFVRLWMGAFGCVAIAALLGGSYHGFGPQLEPSTQRLLWQTMLYALSLASFLMLSATVISTLPERWHFWGLTASSLKTIPYIAWAVTHNHFGYIVADYLSAMVGVLLLQVWALHRQKHPSALWIVAGIGVSWLAAGIQASRWGGADPITYNDLYHLVQMVALYCFYRGVCLCHRKFVP